MSFIFRRLGGYGLGFLSVHRRMFQFPESKNMFKEASV